MNYNNDGKLAKLGMNRTSGTQITRSQHINQSIEDIITTPIGSRIQRREYGSYLFELIDSAGNDAGQLRLLSALIDSISRWEPRVMLEKAALTVTTQGQVTLDYDYHDRQSTDDALKSGQSRIT